VFRLTRLFSWQGGVRALFVEVRATNPDLTPPCIADVDPGNRSRVNESPPTARLGRGLDHERHQAHSGADHPQALARRASAKQWTAEQLIAQGKTVADVCRMIEVTQPPWHRWRQQYGGMQAEEARRLTQLEKENARL
jgi:putative transposase